MKILHVYPKSDSMITSHVRILAESMRHSADVQLADTPSRFKVQLQDMKPDIIHCHGCWQYPIVRAAAMARKMGVRVVISPHGQLEPWVKRGLGRAQLLQRHTIERSYAIITFGKMERKYLEQLGWNPRLEVISNAIITNSITIQNMCSQTFAIYQKVMDSDVLELMDDTTRKALATIIKVGITGDRRWMSPPISDTNINWRHLLIYAEHQNIRNYVDYGVTTLGIQPEQLDTTKIAAYYPDTYTRPCPIKELVGEYKGDEIDYLIRIIRQLQKQPLLLHLIELHRELMRDSVDDDRLSEVLDEKHLLPFTSRLMQILSEQTLLDEGFMPVSPIDDRGTRQIRNSIANHLKI